MQLALIAFIPILTVGILMLGLNWPSMKAMPIAFAVAAVLAFIFWHMPGTWIAASILGAAINTIDILFIIYGALLILRLMKKGGGVNGIAQSMARVSTDRRVQVIVIGFLMGAFFEGAAGFGTPAAVAAPLLVGMGFPPLVAAIVALVGNSSPVIFGAVGTPVVGGFASLDSMIMGAGYPHDFYTFLTQVGGFATLAQFIGATLIPIAMVCSMTLVADKSIKEGLEVFPLALIGGLVFTVPQVIVANFVGPEIASLLSALIAIPVFMGVIKAGIFLPKTSWGFKGDEQTTECAANADNGEGTGSEKCISAGMAWFPYILIGVILLLGRLKWIGLTPVLKAFSIGWSNILGTTISKSITPLYNPGILPFMLVALLIPLMHGIDGKEAAKSWIETIHEIRPAAIALFFALSMTFIMMYSGGATGADSMLLSMAKAAASVAGGKWYIVAPIVGALGSFISGSATVSDIMFGGLQLSAAQQIGLPITAILALQAIGAAAGNMICVHNVVAALTTVGLVGKEGPVIRNNLKLCLAYCVLAGICAFLIVTIFMPQLF